MRRSWRRTLGWAFWPLLVTLAAGTLSVIVPLAIEADRRFAELRSAGGDNVYWTATQAEVDVLRLLVAVQTARETPDPGALADVRLRFDILYSRAGSIARGVIGQELRRFSDATQEPNPLQQFLQDNLALVDGPDADLVDALPWLVDDIRRLHEETRRFALQVMHFFNAESDLQREEIGQLQRRVFWIAICVLSLLVVMTLVLTAQTLWQRRVQVQLEQARRSAEAASRAKSAFLANMSHEIRTPLNGVLAMSEALAGTRLSPAQQEMLQTVRDSGEVLLAIINDILDLARIESGKMTLSIEPFVPADLGRWVEGLHGLAARRKGLSLIVRCDPATRSVRLGDPVRIGQILHNLVGNAVKFTESGQVMLDITVEGPRLCLRVEDSGIGMTEEQLDRVFEEFEQADNSVTRRYGGTGLGLPIVRKLVDLIGGDVRVDSTPGQGTRVEVRLQVPPGKGVLPSGQAAPAIQPAGPAEVQAIRRGTGPGATAAGPAPDPPPEVDLAGLRVLVAEDTPTNRRIIELFLTRMGVSATFAEDGQRACDLWRPGGFDALLLDISMPLKDGVEVLAHIDAQARRFGLARPPAWAATANVMPDQIEAYLAHGFEGVLRKPFRRAELVAVMVEAAKRSGRSALPRAAEA
ncbi:MAG: ATP-binding protein [Alkalilacustris sp.]